MNTQRYLIASAILNVILVPALFALSLSRSIDFSVAGPTIHPAEREQHPAPVTLSDSAFKLCRLKELEHQLIDSLALPSDEFWKPNYKAQLASYLVARMEADRAIRHQLILEFGEQATSMPEFKSAFYPLDMQHPYLSSRDQVRLREYQLENQIDLLSRADIELPAGSAEMGLNPILPGRNGPETILDPHDLHEYKLRTSPLAKRIADADLGLTETQFRSVFKILDAAMPAAGQPPTGSVNIRDELEKYLGASQAVKVMAALDSTFPQIEKVGLQQGLNRAEIYQVYEIFTDIDNRLTSAFEIHNQNAESRRRLMLQAIDERRDRLARLVGDSKVDLFIEARQQQSPLSTRRR